MNILKQKYPVPEERLLDAIGQAARGEGVVPVNINPNHRHSAGFTSDSEDGVLNVYVANDITSTASRQGDMNPVIPARSMEIVTMTDNNSRSTTITYDEGSGKFDEHRVDRSLGGGSKSNIVRDHEEMSSRRLEAATKLAKWKFGLKDQS